MTTRPTCSRRRPYIPAAVGSMVASDVFGRPDIKCSHHMGARITISRQDRHFSLGAPHRPIAFRFHKSLLFLVNFFQDDTSAVADNTLIIKQKSTLPVSKTRQDKSLFCSLSGTCPPPLESGMCRICSAATSPSWTSVAPAPLLSATSSRLRPPPVLHDDLRCCHRRVRPRRYGSGRPGTGSLLLNTKASQEAARARCAAHQNISGVPYR